MNAQHVSTAEQTAKITSYNDRQLQCQQSETCIVKG